MRLLDVLAGVTGGDLGALQTSRGAAEVLRILRADAAERGWRRRGWPGWPGWPTARGRALLPRVRAARAALARGPVTDLVAHLPLATALGALGGGRAPDAGGDVGGPAAEPAWFVPGWREEDRGWRGAPTFVRAAAHREPTGPGRAALGDLAGTGW